MGKRFLAIVLCASIPMCSMAAWPKERAGAATAFQWEEQAFALSLPVSFHPAGSSLASDLQRQTRNLSDVSLNRFWEAFFPLTTVLVVVGLFANGAARLLERDALFPWMMLGAPMVGWLHTVMLRVYLMRLSQSGVALRKGLKKNHPLRPGALWGFRSTLEQEGEHYFLNLPRRELAIHPNIAVLLDSDISGFWRRMLTRSFLYWSGATTYKALQSLGVLVGQARILYVTLYQPVMAGYIIGVWLLHDYSTAYAWPLALLAGYAGAIAVTLFCNTLILFISSSDSMRLWLYRLRLGFFRARRAISRFFGYPQPLVDLPLLEGILDYLNGIADLDEKIDVLPGLTSRLVYRLKTDKAWIAGLDGHSFHPTTMTDEQANYFYRLRVFFDLDHHHWVIFLMREKRIGYQIHTLTSDNVVGELRLWYDASKKRLAVKEAWLDDDYQGHGWYSKLLKTVMAQLPSDALIAHIPLERKSLHILYEELPEAFRTRTDEGGSLDKDEWEQSVWATIPPRVRGLTPRQEARRKVLALYHDLRLRASSLRAQDPKAYAEWCHQAPAKTVMGKAIIRATEHHAPVMLEFTRDNEIQLTSIHGKVHSIAPGSYSVGLESLWKDMEEQGSIPPLGTMRESHVRGDEAAFARAWAQQYGDSPASLLRVMARERRETVLEYPRIAEEATLRFLQVLEEDIPRPMGEELLRTWERFQKFFPIMLDSESAFRFWADRLRSAGWNDPDIASLQKDHQSRHNVWETTRRDLEDEDLRIKRDASFTEGQLLKLESWLRQYHSVLEQNPTHVLLLAGLLVFEEHAPLHPALWSAVLQLDALSLESDGSLPPYQVKRLLKQWAADLRNPPAVGSPPLNWADDKFLNTVFAYVEEFYRRQAAPKNPDRPLGTKDPFADLWHRLRALPFVFSPRVIAIQA